MLTEKLSYYNSIVGTKGETIGSLFRFKNKPNSDFPRIYYPHESVLDHETRLVCNTKKLLTGFLPESDILEIQEMLVCHDVKEIFDGDISRLDGEGEEQMVCEDDGGQIFLPGDLKRYQDFLIAQAYLEKNGEQLPESFHSVLARVLDTLDGNFYAFALLANYASKVGGEEQDPNLQLMLDRSYAYVNKTRVKYRENISKLNGKYPVDLSLLLEYLLGVESENLASFSSTLQEQGYKTSEVI